MQTNLIRVLTRREIQQVIESLNRSAREYDHTNLMIFRLSCQVGLRRKEMAGLSLRDVVPAGERPVVSIPAAITKADKRGKRHKRHVPLWWDDSTRAALADWKKTRVQDQAKPTDPFICMTRGKHRGGRFNPKMLAKRWKSCLRILGEDRANQLSIHTGRRSYVSHCLTAGRSLAEVAAACGHNNINTTNQYVHLIESGSVPDVFSFLSQVGD